MASERLYPQTTHRKLNYSSTPDTGVEFPVSDAAQYNQPGLCPALCYTPLGYCGSVAHS